MDPEVAYRRLILAVGKLRRKVDAGSLTSDDHAVVEEAVEAVEALDEWLVHGGALPSAWETRLKIGRDAS